MLATGGTHTLEVVFLFLLIVVAFFAGLARRIDVPYPILLVIAGLGISFVPHVPQIPLKPDLVFAIFLPPLLYAAAWQTNWRDFRRNLLSISMLAFGLVGFTVLCIAFFASYFIHALDFRSGFLLGAIVAATDAVAATSIARSLGISRRITSVLEGESLLNDATALLALEFGLALLLDGTRPTVLGGSARLLWLTVGGVGVGLLLGYIMTFVERWIDEGSLEMVVSLIVPYVAYLAAEELKASGVLAVVACGLFLSRRSGNFLSAPARLEILSAWKALDFILNGIVFVLIGLQLPYILAGIRGESIGHLIFYGVSFSALLIALRLIWIFPSARTSFWIRRRLFHLDVTALDRKSIFLVGWTGMRGVVSLAAAFSLPFTLPNGEPFQQRNLIVFLTFCIILVTLVVQGLSLPPLIRALGLGGEDREVAEEHRYALRVTTEGAIAALQARRENADDNEQHDIDDLLHKYEHRLEAVRGKVTLEDGSTDTEPIDRLKKRAELLRSVASVEREVLLELRDAGSVGDEIIRSLERDLDLAEVRVQLQDRLH
jgi:Na+/H+ antiporter